MGLFPVPGPDDLTVAIAGLTFARGGPTPASRGESPDRPSELQVFYEASLPPPEREAQPPQESAA